MAVWIVRGGRVGEYEELALSEGVVAVSFGFRKSIADFADRESLHVQAAEAQVSVYGANQLWRFANEIKIGETVVLPRKLTKTIAIGKVQGAYVYRTDLEDLCPHTLKVDWQVEDIPRVNFSQDLVNSMGGLATVFQVLAEDAESRLENVVEAHLKSEASPEEREPASDDDEIIGSPLTEQIEDRIVRHIRRTFGGKKLERLVASVLEASGYDVLETRPGPDLGADIVAGKGDLGFGVPRLCVQVKSGRRPVDRPAYQQLQGSIGTFGADHGLLVSMGGFKDTVRRENERSFFQIRLWGPYELVQRLLETYDDLPQDIRSEIPLQDRKVLIETEA